MRLLRRRICGCRFGCAADAQRIATLGVTGFDQSQLNIIDRQRMPRPVVKTFQGVDRQFCIAATDRDPVAAPRHRHIQRLFDLAQIFVQRAAEIGQPYIVIARCCEFFLSYFQSRGAVLLLDMRVNKGSNTFILKQVRTAMATLAGRTRLGLDVFADVLNDSAYRRQDIVIDSDNLSPQGMRVGLIDQHIDHLSRQSRQRSRRGGEVDHAVVLRTAMQFIRIFP